MIEKSIKISPNFKSNDDIDILLCAWCFSAVEMDDDYCWRCGRLFDEDIDPVSDFVELYRHIGLLNTKDLAE